MRIYQAIYLVRCDAEHSLIFLDHEALLPDGLDPHGVEMLAYDLARLLQLGPPELLDAPERIVRHEEWTIDEVVNWFEDKMSRSRYPLEHWDTYRRLTQPNWKLTNDSGFVAVAGLPEFALQSDDDALNRAIDGAANGNAICMLGMFLIGRRVNIKVTLPDMLTRLLVAQVE